MGPIARASQGYLGQPNAIQGAPIARDDGPALYATARNVNAALMRAFDALARLEQLNSRLGGVPPEPAAAAQSPVPIADNLAGMLGDDAEAAARLAHALESVADRLEARA